MTDDTYIDEKSYYELDTFDLDYPVEPLEVNSTSSYCGPHCTVDQWYSFPDDTKKIWDMLNAVLYHYAYTRRGKTIHSCTQFEAFKQMAYDKSPKAYLLKNMYELHY